MKHTPYQRVGAFWWLGTSHLVLTSHTLLHNRFTSKRIWILSDLTSHCAKSLDFLRGFQLLSMRFQSWCPNWAGGVTRYITTCLLHRTNDPRQCHTGINSRLTHLEATRWMKIYIPDVFHFSRCFTKPASIDKLTQLTMAIQTFVATVVGALAVTCAAFPNAPKPTSAPSHSRYINYTTVTGFFAQDDPATDASTFDYVCAPIFRNTLAIAN